MKFFLLIFLLGGCCVVTKGQDYGSANLKFINSLITVSNSQYQRAFEYINEYSNANLQLTQLASTVVNNFQNVFNSTNVQSFLLSIREHLSTNVTKLTVKFSPDNVRNYILFYYNNFLSNLSLNNGTQSEISEMNQLYITKIFNFEATGCLTKYNAAHLEIYSRAVSNFTGKIETDISATVDQLESLRQEIKVMITDLVKSLGTIIATNGREEEFEEFINRDGNKILDQVDNWIEKFTSSMKQTQLNIGQTFELFDSSRVNETLSIINETRDCLNAL